MNGPLANLRKLSRRAAAAIAMLAACGLCLVALFSLAPATHAAQDENGLEIYASPLEIAVSPEGARLYVLCRTAAKFVCSTPQNSYASSSPSQWVVHRAA